MERKTKFGFTLAEGTSYCNLLPKKVRFGFTLAEVLIVIGVIGVVAALTIPTLIKNHQKNVWVEQLKTSVVKIQDGFRLAMAEDGVDDLGETELWSMIPANDTINISTIKTTGEPFTSRLSQYLKIGLIQDNSEYSFKLKLLYGSGYAPNTYSAIQLLNGATITSFSFYGTDKVKTSYTKENARLNGGAMWKQYGNFMLDVNGQKGPNQIGRDIFSFYIAQNGLLYPHYGKEDAIYDNVTRESYNNNSHYNCSTTTNSDGNGCAARIIEEGWKMTY